MKVYFELNGEPQYPEVEPGESLLSLLRRLGTKSVKFGCGIGDCGACTVLMDGRPVASCLVLAVEADGCDITTIEDLSENGELHPLQKSFVKHGALQCGFCTPGMLMTSTQLLRDNPHPSQADIRMAISGNLCRCTGYQKIVEAIQHAAEDKHD